MIAGQGKTTRSAALDQGKRGNANLVSRAEVDAIDLALGGDGRQMDDAGKKDEGERTGRQVSQE